MSAHTVTGVSGTLNLGAGFKASIITFTGSASYDANGSSLALATTDTGFDKHTGFTTILGGTVIQVAGTNKDKYIATFVSDATTSPKVVVRDCEAMTAAGEVSGDISGLTFTAIVFGT